MVYDDHLPQRLPQTAHNLYLVFDLCTGGELFDRICAKGNYYEEYGQLFESSVFLLIIPRRDAANLVRTILKAVKYIHESGIVHRGMPLSYREVMGAYLTLCQT